MKKSLIVVLGCFVLSCFMLLIASASFPTKTFALTVTGPLSEADFDNLTTGASYCPPPAAHFFEPGPITVPSGVSANLYAGPAPGQSGVDDLLFVLSLDPVSLSSLGTITFEIASSAVNFGSVDFYSTSDAGFPASIEGIANGEVNGIKFPEALHGGLLVDGFSFGSLSADALIGNVTVTSSVPLRIDIFGIGDEGHIINNTPNSGALGVVPEPATMLLLGTGLVGLVGFRKKFKK